MSELQESVNKTLALLEETSPAWGKDFYNGIEKCSRDLSKPMKEYCHSLLEKRPDAANFFRLYIEHGQSLAHLPWGNMDMEARKKFESVKMGKCYELSLHIADSYLKEGIEFQPKIWWGFVDVISLNYPEKSGVYLHSFVTMEKDGVTRLDDVYSLVRSRDSIYYNHFGVEIPIDYMRILDKEACHMGVHLSYYIKQCILPSEKRLGELLFLLENEATK